MKTASTALALHKDEISLYGGLAMARNGPLSRH